MKYLISTLVAAIASFGTSRALAQDSAMPQGLEQRIDTLVRAFRASTEAPGIAVAVARGDQLLYETGFGYANLTDSVAVTAETVFRTASVAKPMTAVAVLQLASRGELDLDAPIQKYCPSYPVKRWPVTARQLLRHTAGVRHPTDGEDEQTAYYETIDEALTVFAADSLLHEPGSRRSYSTLGYMVLGCAIEGASGLTFMEYLRQNVLEPARMESTTRDTMSRSDPRRVAGYRKTESGVEPSLLVDTSFKLAGGGLSASAGDVARFGAALAGDQLLSPECTSTMFEPVVLADRTGSPHGMAGQLLNFGRPLALMTGQQEEATALLLLDPESGLSIAVRSNLERSVQPMAPLAFGMLQAIVDHR